MLNQWLDQGWDFYKDHSRYINLGLLVLVIAALTSNILLRRNKATRRSRRIMMWVYFLLCNIVYGISIAITENRSFNGAVGVNTILLVGMLLSILWHPEGDDKTPPHDGSIGTRFVQWLDTNVRTAKGKRALRFYQSGLPTSVQHIPGRIHHDRNVA